MVVFSEKNIVFAIFLIIAEQNSYAPQLGPKPTLFLLKNFVAEH
jgi:hypothetical protein